MTLRNCSKASRYEWVIESKRSTPGPTNSKCEEQQRELRPTPRTGTAGLPQRAHKKQQHRGFCSLRDRQSACNYEGNNREWNTNPRHTAFSKEAPADGMTSLAPSAIHPLGRKAAEQLGATRRDVERRVWAEQHSSDRTRDRQDEKQFPKIPDVVGKARKEFVLNLLLVIFLLLFFYL